MPFVRISIPLLAYEHDALATLALQERRRIEAQAAWMIRCDLQHRGLIPIPNSNPVLLTHEQLNVLDYEIKHHGVVQEGENCGR